MRTLFVVSLALVIVALPAAQAEACRCDVESSATSCGCCCAATDRACSCCPTGDEEEQPDRMDGACPCSLTAPQAPTPAVDDLPAGEVLVTAPCAATFSTGRAHVSSAVEYRTPHPTEFLPLLL